MAEPQADAYALLEAHFNDHPQLQHGAHLPRRTDELRTYSATAAPLMHDTARTDDETDSIYSARQPTPLEPPAALNGAESGLPPTPPTLSQDGQSTQAIETRPHADDVVNSLSSKKSALSTPVNARSPPTPDPSPPRTGATLERPHMLAYPSSRAESFMTAREDPFSSEPSESRSLTPAADRLSTVDEDRGLGLAFELEDNNTTPTESIRRAYPPNDADTTAGAEEEREASIEDVVPDREWNTDLMRNVTIRRKRKPSTSPRKVADPGVAVVETASPSPSPRPRRTSGLRERVEASEQSPITPSIENFAHSIGWPSEDRTMTEDKVEDRGRESKRASTEEKGQDRGREDKRNSTSSMGSTVVEAKIIVTPPRRRQTLRHSGKNMAYKDEEGSPTPDRRSRRHSNRQSSSIAEDVPLHRLVHKRVSLADRTKRISAESDTLGSERSVSSPLSFRSRIIDSSAATLRHQESVRMVLQPAADILSRSNSITYHKRITSAPEPVRKSALSHTPRQYLQLSPSNSPRRIEHVKFQMTTHEHSPPSQSPAPSFDSPRSLKRRQRSNVVEAKQPVDVNKSLPKVPHNSLADSATSDGFLGAGHPEDERRPPSALMERVRQLVAAREAAEDAESGVPKASEQPAASAPVATLSPPHEESSPAPHFASPSSRGRSSLSQERSSASPEVVIRPSLDRTSTDEMARPSHDWRRPSEEHGRVSFDRSTIRTEEHAGARHLYASTTPFSQVSDTLEVSEATAVSIFPHNNHSLLVVQQVSRINSMAPDGRQLESGDGLSPDDYREVRSTPTPPFVDASESHHDGSQHHGQPTLNFEPSTPPMQIALPQPSAVDSPLKNPRPPPSLPKITFIPPTPMEELEKELVPGPPKRSDSHPQRRISLVQRARRYSDNLIPTLLYRAGSNRGRYASDSHRSHRKSAKVPSVNEEDGNLHPFWRPKGFWDAFSDSDSSEEGLHPGGDTSDVESEPEPEPPKRSNTLSKRLTSGFRGSGGFLIGNSLGVERHGTNKRRHHVTLPPHFPKSPKTSAHTSSPKIMIQPPTFHDSSNRVTKRGSRGSLRAERRGSWRQGKSLPGLGKKYELQYIGLSGVKERFREGRKEKRREKIRQSIGSRVYDENGGPNAT